MITHDNKQYFCTICKFKTIRPATFRRHLKDHKNRADDDVEFFAGNDGADLNSLTQESGHKFQTAKFYI